MRLIDADRLKEAFSADLQHLQTLDQHTIFIIENDIDESPTIEAVPVVHGQWIKEKCQGDYGRCSKCDCRIRWIPKNYKYCPNCGAKMGGDT